ncbi:hypothetical protein TcasGA2_TC034795 [Tribolium castaneum]|uniref:Uncharacterized protein n=1 Tax=Tribolium castaneum TaxID=7070 RepID=A0A139WEQ4_TRICA|nr:hypothetical protein TcasGA2_TC034795 [Tribolium castaneum]
MGDDLWGDVYANWTGIGLFGSVLNDEIDIGYAAVYTWEEYYKFMDYTKTLIRSGVTCLVPAPQLAAGWVTPLRSFSLGMWIALVIVLLSNTIVLNLLFYRNQNKRFFIDSLTTAIKLYVQQPLTLTLKRGLLKYFIVTNMIMVLFISSSYSSGLSSVMTVPRYGKSIQTVKDLASSHLNWTGTTDAWIFSLRQVEEAITASKQYNFGFSVERLPYGHYAVGPYIQRDVICNYRIMQEDLYWGQCTFLLRKNSVLLPLLDKLILRVFEAGLEAYWENQVVYQFMDMSVQRGIMFYTRHIIEHDTIKLTWEHVEGAFAVLVLGYAASIFTFVIELILDKDILIHHENASDIFVQFENLIRLHSERFNARRYIVTGQNSLQILLTKELEYVSDLLLVVPNDGEYFEMITHTYGHKINEPVLLDIWYSHNYTFERGNDMFPNKLSNQNGRTFKIGTFTYEPYSITGTDDYSFHGTETSLVYEFVRKYNLTPSFTVIGDELWGDIYDNWTGIGLLGSVLDDSVDIGYAAVYTWEDYYKFMDYTKPLTRTGITCIVPAPQLAAGWFTPLRSFSLEMWIALLVVLLSDAVVLSLIFYGDHNKRFVTDSIMTLIKLYLLQSLTIPLKGKLLKYFIAMNMIMVLLISSSYSSGLSSVMTVPRYDKAIRTIKDLASSGLPWGATSDAWLISLRQVNEEDYKIIKNRFVVKKEDDLTASSRLHNFGFSLERLPYGHYAVGPYIKPDVIANYRIMQEDIYWEQCIFVIRKNSVLLSLLDNLILRVFEAGLEAYWENEAITFEAKI